tara:strand:- start:2799 stop:3725 length:927 start_codon:yes stop_codon:yes gene_type:complete
MTFFNKKEDVMKIELTPHGRDLLRKGQLNPKYYAFFDDDILYDTTAAGFSENNNEIKARIINDTPSLKPQTTQTGVESRFFDQFVTEDDNILLNPIGTNKLTSTKANGWQTTAILGEFSSSTSFISSQVSAMHTVPQVECELNFTMSIGHLRINDYVSVNYNTSLVANDETFLKLETDQLLLHLLEKNGFSYKDSLSLEVFKYDFDETNFYKLLMIAENESLKTDILEDTPEESPGDTSVTVNENYVENYFFVRTDRQISDSDLCRGIKKLKEKNIYLGLDIQCDERIFNDVNIYQTEVTDQDIEDCE